MKAKELIAYCWASGLIQFGYTLPYGAIEIARGRAGIVRRVITATARISRHNKELLVPGVPEASNDRQAILALELHCRWLKQSERDGLVVNARRSLPRSRSAVRRLVAKMSEGAML